MKPNLFEAVHVLVGGEISGGNDLTKYVFHNGQIPPSKEKAKKKLAELQAEYDALQYQRDRASQYPSITDVVVALAEKQEGDDSMWKEITALRQKVKTDNPKPT